MLYWCYSLIFFFFIPSQKTVQTLQVSIPHRLLLLRCKIQLDPRRAFPSMTNFFSSYTERERGKKKKSGSVQSWVSPFYTLCLPPPKDGSSGKNNNLSLHHLTSHGAIGCVLSPFLSRNTSDVFFRVNLQPMGTALQTIYPETGFSIPET